MPQYYPTPGSYRKITGITPSDSALLPPGVRALLVEGAGNVTVLMPGAATPFLFTAVPAMTVLPVSPSKVMATGTTATNINAMG